MTAPLVRVPGLSTRSSRRWLVGTAVAAVAVGAYLGATQPGNRVYVVTAYPALTLFFVVLLWQSTWVDPVAGRVLRVRCRIWRREVPLAPGTEVALVPNGAGAVLLRARPRGARGLVLPVVTRTDYVERSQPPDLLRVLADAVERHHADGAGSVARVLRRQADHLAAGGTVAGSPLGLLVTSGARTAAGTGGERADGGRPG